MEYYIQKRKWKQIYAFIKSIKGIHKKDENQLRRKQSDLKWLPVVSFTRRQLQDRRFKKWCEKEIWGTQQDPDLEVFIIDGFMLIAGYKKDSQVQEALGWSKFTTMHLFWN